MGTVPKQKIISDNENITNRANLRAEPKATDGNLRQSTGELPLNISGSQALDSAAASSDNVSYYYGEKMSVIRLISMLFIVWAHCLLGWENVRFVQPGFQFLQALILETGKLGTISFFVISGYFLSDRLYKYNVPGYLKHRFFTLILPWIIFLFLYVFIELFEVYPIKLIFSWNIGYTIHLSMVLARSFIFYSAYWFLPMSLLSIVVLIICRNYVKKLWFIALLIVMTLFYCVNLYYKWVPANHTKSVMGYTFFIWLGVAVKNNEIKIRDYLARISWNMIIPLLFVLLCIACYEAMGLMKRDSGDPFSTIRFSNIIVSILLFFALLKTERLNWLNFLNPRTYVFGIYLTHCIVFSQLRIIINHLVPNQIDINHIGISLLLQLAFFLIVFATTYFIVYLIKHSPVKAIVGI